MPLVVIAVVGPACSGTETHLSETVAAPRTTTVPDGGGEGVDLATTVPDGGGEGVDLATTVPDGGGEGVDLATTVPDGGGEGDSAVEVTSPPAELGLDPFYEKYLDLEGIPIVADARVSDAALFEARRLLSEMLIVRPEILAAMATSPLRVVIKAKSSGITEIPEIRELSKSLPDIDWDNRYWGGVGPTFAVPVMAVAEENLLCYITDWHPNEDLFVHEAAHAVLDMGIEMMLEGYELVQRLERSYRDALDAGIWHGTYAATNLDEYWAEGVQSWFDVNDPPGPLHNHVDTRSELELYDPGLAGVIADAFGDSSVSSCHNPGPRTLRNYIRGAVLGPDGTGIAGAGLWVWSGTESTSSFTRTHSDGTFAVAVPDGSFSLDVYASPSEYCTFVGWYGPDGFTTERESAIHVLAYGESVSGIEIILPRELDELPFIEWCA